MQLTAAQRVPSKSTEQSAELKPTLSTPSNAHGQAAKPQLERCRPLGNEEEMVQSMSQSNSSSPWHGLCALVHSTQMTTDPGSCASPPGHGCRVRSCPISGGSCTPTATRLPASKQAMPSVLDPRMVKPISWLQPRTALSISAAPLHSGLAGPELRGISTLFSRYRYLLGIL